VIIRESAGLLLRDSITDEGGGTSWQEQQSNLRGSDNRSLRRRSLDDAVVENCYNEEFPFSLR
jgi:hypothetical protein